MRTMITAHSGAENTPDNTMESVCVQLSCGADAIEVDVRMHSGRLIMAHDDAQSEKGYDQLEDCLREASKYDGVIVNLDLKQPGLVRPAAELAEACGMTGRILFTGDLISADDIACAREKQLTIWYNHTQAPEGIPLLQGATDAGFEVLNAHYTCATDDMLSDAPERLSLWTVNDEAWLEKLLRAGVRNITTRRPVFALRMREKIQG